MNEDKFTFSPVEDNGQGPMPGYQCGPCPFSLFPPRTWQRLLKQPFRQRHPIFFWGGILALGCLVFLGGMRFAKDDEDHNDKLALVTVSGPIMDVAPTLNWLGKIANDATVKGVLLRVDSPGGGAAASQEVYSALEKLAQKMPVAVSMGATAASGGLMVSMAGKRIFANPSTITGSIGVRMDVPQLQGLMGKLGIGQETLVTAPFKDAISYTRPMTAEDRAYLETVLMNMHEQFVGIVARGRNMSHEKAAQLANGKIFTGQQALALGLVDEMGGQESAHAWLCQQTGVPQQRKLLKNQASHQRLLERLLSVAKMLAPELASLISKSDPQPVFTF